MGHASVQITLDRYGHLLPDTGREEMQKLDRVMDGGASGGDAGPEWSPGSSAGNMLCAA
jgi:hypothetical protein